MDLVVPAEHKMEIKEKEKITKKAVEHECDGIINCSCWPWIGEKSRRIGNQKKNQNHPDKIIVEISQKTEKTPGDQRRLAVIQTPVNNHQLTLA